MTITRYKTCEGCGKQNIVGKRGLCFLCYHKARKAERLADIREKIAIAEAWLLEKHEPEKFDEGMERYKVLQAELLLLEG